MAKKAANPATVTLKLAEPWLFLESTAVHVTLCVPRANVAPDAGAQFTPAIAPSTASTATGFA